MTFLKIKNLVFLLAIPLGFGLATWFGLNAESYSKPSRFVRFHYHISPETLFFPTFSMMENLALSRWKPGKTIVIIAGNSILNGYGQNETDLWSLRLQDELGERYAVVNLSFRGALPFEGGMLVAESLQRRGLPVVLVTNTSPGTVGRVAGETYGYLYYDALYKQRLYSHPARSANILEWEKTASKTVREQQTELRRGSLLDSWFHFQGLWHHIAYRYFFTTWNQRTRLKFWQSRDKYTDDLPVAPGYEQRFQSDLSSELEITRGFSFNLAELDAKAGWKLLQPPMEIAGDLIEDMIPKPIRARTIVLLSQNAPIYRSKLTSSERDRDETVFKGYAALWESYGFTCKIVGEDFENYDFYDRSHLSATGGSKLAHLVADYVRQLTRP